MTAKFGLHGNFTDREGFPDEDAAAIIETKTKRGRRAVLSTDHVRVMREIEERLFVRKPDVERTVPTSSPLLTEYVPQPLPSESRPPPPSLKPLARVETVTSGSPAAAAGLKAGDEIMRFGRVNSSRVDAESALLAIRDAVTAHENQRISLVVERNNDGKRSTHVIALTPKAWAGRGLLGCHLVPV